MIIKRFCSRSSMWRRTTSSCSSTCSPLTLRSRPWLWLVWSSRWGPSCPSLRCSVAWQPGFSRCPPAHLLFYLKDKLPLNILFSIYLCWFVMTHLKRYLCLMHCYDPFGKHWNTNKSYSSLNWLNGSISSSTIVEGLCLVDIAWIALRVWC